MTMPMMMTGSTPATWRAVLSSQSLGHFLVLAVSFLVVFAVVLCLETRIVYLGLPVVAIGRRLLPTDTHEVILLSTGIADGSFRWAPIPLALL